MLTLFTPMLAGWIIRKAGAVPEGTQSVLSKLETHAFVPALVLSTFAGNFTREKLSSAWRLALAGLCVGIVMIAVAVPLSKLFSKDGYTRNIYAYGLAASVVRLIVFPLLWIGIFAIFPVPFDIKICAVASLAMSLGLNSVIIPGGYGKDTSAAAGMAVVSHLMSAFTVPFVFWSAAR